MRSPGCPLLTNSVGITGSPGSRWPWVNGLLFPQGPFDRQLSPYCLHHQVFTSYKPGSYTAWPNTCWHPGAVWHRLCSPQEPSPCHPDSSRCLLCSQHVLALPQTPRSFHWAAFYHRAFASALPPPGTASLASHVAPSLSLPWDTSNIIPLVTHPSSPSQANCHVHL